MKAIVAAIIFFAWLSPGMLAVHAQGARPLDVPAAIQSISRPVAFHRVTEGAPSSASGPSATDQEVSREYITLAKGEVVRIRYRSGLIAEHPCFEVPVLFIVASDDLFDARSAENVRHVAAVLTPFIASGASFRIEGHISAQDERPTGQMLSTRRAERICELLVAHQGLDSQQLSYRGFGTVHARHPADAPEAQRLQDRRILIVRVK